MKRDFFLKHPDEVEPKEDIAIGPVPGCLPKKTCLMYAL